MCVFLLIRVFFFFFCLLMRKIKSWSLKLCVCFFRLLVQLVDEYGIKKWSQIAKMLEGRVGKQCRERWHNHLRPDIRVFPSSLSKYIWLLFVYTYTHTYIHTDILRCISDLSCLISVHMHVYHTLHVYIRTGIPYILHICQHAIYSISFNFWNWMIRYFNACHTSYRNMTWTFWFLFKDVWSFSIHFYGVLNTCHVYHLSICSWQLMDKLKHSFFFFF